MSFNLLLRQSDDAFYFQGDLTFQIILDAKRIFGIVRNDGTDIVTLDLARVRRCDSFGLDMILALQYCARKSGKRCVVSNASEAVVYLARRANLNRLLEADGG